MRRLRQKVEVDPNKPVHLLTVRGVGYRLIGPDERAVDDGDMDPLAERGASAGP